MIWGRVRRRLKPETPVLVAADRMLRSTRQGDYGDPVGNWSDVAAGWSVILGAEVTAEKAALMMVWLKTVRASKRHDPDDLVDMAAYIAITQDCRNGS